MCSGKCRINKRCSRSRSGRWRGTINTSRARALILEHGWNTTAYQILNPGFQLWFSRQHPATVGYVQSWRRRIVGGAPVCAPEHLADVAREFEADATTHGDGVVYFGAEARLEALYACSSTHAKITLGAQPTWTPSEWSSIVAHHASLRAQLNRARNKGVRVESWTIDAASQHDGLHRCLEEWLATRPLPPLHFLVEPETLSNLHDRLLIVALRNDTPIGFVVASPIPARRGWLTEQFVRGHTAPNGTAELMIDAAVREMATRDAQYVTMGLAPLAPHASAQPDTPAWLRFAFTWIHAHGRRFYNFDGLDTFKSKFRPERWEPVYAIANEPRFSPRSLYAIASAFTNGAPFRTVARGMTKAIAQEIRWLTQHDYPVNGNSNNNFAGCGSLV